jgi:primosomal protein N' (replication factor Y)
MPPSHTSLDGASDAPANWATPPARVRVLLPVPLAGAYDYAVPDGMNVAPGDFVSVPLGARQLAGVVWGPSSDEIDAAKVKPLRARLDAPPLSGELRLLIDWVAAYTLSPPGAVLRMAMSVPDALEPARMLVGYGPSGAGRALLDDAAAVLTPQRHRVLAAAAELPGTATDLAQRAACGAGVVRGLVQAGLLAAVPLARRAPLVPPDWRLPGATLSPAQELAATDLIARVERGGFGVTFLDGVTGSGKTEVYFAAIAAALARGRQVLVLLPEIALSAQWLRRFARRFGAPPAQWHSDLGHTQRRDTWRAVADGEARLVVGARSALFLPYHE